MDADAQYARACLPQFAYRVCGVRLKPFSLGHMLALQQAQSPFVMGDLERTMPHELVYAVWLCSMQATQAMAAMGSPWGLRWRFLVWRVRLCQRCDRMLYLTRVAMMQEYVTKHYERVEVWRVAGKTATSGMAIVQLYKRALMSMGYSQAEVLDMPFPQAVWEYTAWLDKHDAVRFPTKDELEMVAAAREARKAAKTEAAA